MYLRGCCMVENMELVAGETEGGGGVNTVLMYPQKKS